MVSKVPVTDVIPNAKTTRNRLHGDNLESLHVCLQCTAGVDLCASRIHKTLSLPAQCLQCGADGPNNSHRDANQWNLNLSWKVVPTYIPPLCRRQQQRYQHVLGECAG